MAPQAAPGGVLPGGTAVSAEYNGHFPTDVLSAAQTYHGLGLVPIPIPREGRRKAPALTGWQDLRPTREDDSP